MIMIPAALMTAFMMPIIGMLIQKGVKPQYLAACGMFLFFIYSLWGHQILTPNTPGEAFFWMLMVRGAAMGMLFIPVSTMSLSTLKGQQIGQGASFTGMMRQLGGSFGIALITTFMTIGNATHRNDLLQHVTNDNTNLQGQLQGLTAKFMAAGMPPNVAAASAYKMIDGSVMRQAAVLTYMDVFLYIGIMFLICVPFILMIRSSRQKVNMADAMH